MSNLYRRRPAEIEAIQWTDTNAPELEAFAGPRFMTVDPEDRIDDADATASLRESAHECWSLLRPGDWVVKRGDDDFAALRPEEFTDLYEARPDTRAPNAAAIRRTLRRWAYAAGHIESELDGAVDRMYTLIAEDIAAADRDTEIEQMRERHKANLRRADEINNELMAEVQRYAAGTERPVLWSVYNRMHLRALCAEAVLKRAQRTVRRLAAHAAGFRDALDDTDRSPWGRTVGADIAELIEVLADLPADEAQQEAGRG